MAAPFGRSNRSAPVLFLGEIEERWLVHMTTVIFSAALVRPV